MSKRVHFAARDTYHPPSPSLSTTDSFKTPSPTPSDSSVPSTSSSELSTPPPPHNFYPHPPTPYYQPRQLYLPPPQQDVYQYQELEPKTMQIHRLLAYTPYTAPPVPFDLTLPPSVPAHLLPPGTALSDPATHPPLGNITISLPHFLPWEIAVHPSHGAGFITVLDVLHALYGGLRPAVHPAEYDALSREDAERVNAAYFERCRRIGDPVVRAVEERKGVKRVDLLCGTTRFMGLCVAHGTDVWELNVS